jgi:subtilisin-like proprotein convertase family protein
MKTLILVLAIPLIATGGLAQWSTDPTVNTPVCIAGSDQKETVVASDGAGGAFVAWRDYRNDPTMFGGDIFAQHINGRGEARWSTDGVILHGTSTGQFRPQMADDGLGGAIIVWARNYGGFYGYNLFAQRIDAAGNRLWGANGVTVTSGSATNTFHVVIPDGEGGVIIGWQQIPVVPGMADIFAQKLSADGVALWAANGVAVCNHVENQTFPQLVSDGAGGAIFCWMDSRNGMVSDIYVQRIGSNGTRLWENDGVPVCTEPASQSAPVLCTDRAGGAIVVWEDSRGTGTSVFAQRLNNDGQAQWETNGRQISPAGADARTPVACEDGEYGAVLGWIEDAGPTDEDIVTQRIDADGSLLWDPDGVDICLASHPQLNLSFEPHPAGGFVLAWLDLRSGIADIYAQWVDEEGQVQWDGNGVALTTAPGEQTYPAVTTDGLGGAIVAWNDQRNGNADIYVQNIDYSGTRGSARDIYRRSGLARIIHDAQSVSDTIVAVPPSSMVLPALYDVTVLVGNVTHSSVQDLSFTLTHEGLHDTLIYRVDGAGGENFEGTFLNDVLGRPFEGASAPFSGVYQPYHPLSTFVGADPAGTWILTVTDHAAGNDGLLEDWSLLLSFTGTTDVRPEPGVLPIRAGLSQNYPNPFNPHTVIGFSIPEAGRVTLKVYDLLGREVSTLVDHVKAPGIYEVGWDATGQSSGVYYYQMRVDNVIQTRKMVLVR